MKIEFKLKIIWSNNRWLLPASNIITENGKTTGYTNRFGKFTYRIKPVLKIIR